MTDCLTVEPKRWDIFCKLVDNFGDIGVCWRLARQLSTENGFSVRLWIDDPAPLALLCPAFDPLAIPCFIDGIEINHWNGMGNYGEIGDVVVEAFGCELPIEYLDAMEERASPPLWINLEYLSAESWVEACHRLPSPHPSRSLTRFFFFPGFSSGTGGLLREADLGARRVAFQADPAAQAGMLAGLGVHEEPPGAIDVSLFAYDHPRLEDLVRAWSASDQPVCVRVPEGRILPRLGRALGLGGGMAVGDRVRQGALRVHVLPFVPQPEYDRLLWASDLNFVRGEDSFVRAQWARRPLVWQIYPQHDEIHHAKLEAFMERYCEGLEASAARALRHFWRAWNGVGGAPTLDLAWPEFAAALPALRAHAQVWAEGLEARPDLAAQLVQFCKQQVK